MISCTEFIPAYSELFAFIEETSGREAVDLFWKYLFEPDGEGIPLINYLEKEGIKGCYTYWAGSLNEEAADFTMYLNEKAGWYMIKMHHCPSKGRLLELKEEKDFVPYHDYCLHCDYYRSAVEKAGFKYIYNFSGIENASCSLLIYDPKKFDGRVIVDENTVVMDRKASQNEYFHQDFHSSMNMGINYIGEKYGLEGIKAYLKRYTENIHRDLIVAVKENGISALETAICKIYEKEKASDAISTELNNDILTVNVKYCPVVQYLKSTGRKVSKWYRYIDELVMNILAEKTGLTFKMKFYDEETGASEYFFEKVEI